MAGLDTMIFPFYTEYWSFLVFFVLFSIGVVWRYSGSRWYHLDAELRQRGYSIPDTEEQDQTVIQTNPFLDEAFLQNQDEYLTSGSLLFSGTLKNAVLEDPDYVNLEYLKKQNMDQSTNL
uniref:Uncharacterized protein n=1 Tax=Caenorhabditis japonica TaxID=281687 RepID=A0A8R1IB38_CAEJA